MVKRLPIRLDTAVITECWTFERLAVIQASAGGEDWLASHLSLCMDQHYACFFGDWDTHYTPAYYEDILTVREISPYGRSGEALLSLFIALIRDGRYVMVTLCSQRENPAGAEAFHEALLYGFDEERRVFWAPELRQTALVETEIPFERVLASLDCLKAYMRACPAQRYQWASGYQPPLSSLAVRPDYTPDHVYDAMQKLIPEIWGKKVRVSELTPELEPYDGKTVYRGLGCLLGLREALARHLGGEAMPAAFPGFPRNLKKLWEHRRNLLFTMRYILKQWVVSDPEAEAFIEAYSLCADRAEQWLYLDLAGERSGNRDRLARIFQAIPAAYREEYQALCGFYNRVFAWYQTHHEQL